MELRRRAELCAEEMAEQGWADTSILILGDFNAEPTEASVESILSQRGRDCGSRSWQFRSACPLRAADPPPGNGAPYTTWKTRKDGMAR